MKLLIKTTVQPPSKPSLDDWKRYIGQPVLYANTPKEGGICYEEHMNHLLKDAKRIVSPVSYNDRVKYDRIAYIVGYILIIIIAFIVR